MENDFGAVVGRQPEFGGFGSGGGFGDPNCANTGLTVRMCLGGSTRYPGISYGSYFGNNLIVIDNHFPGEWGLF